MNTTVRRGAAVFLVVLSTACGSSGPTTPTAIPQPLPVPAPTAPPTRTFPPLSGPSRTFVFDHELAYAVRDYTRKSRIVLYDNGAFVLRYDGIGDYRGGFTESNGVMTFDWEGWSVAGPWGASGTLEKTSLTIRFNFIMQMTDFEDAVYVLMPST
jgi:hypothetical protein